MDGVYVSTIETFVGMYSDVGGITVECQMWRCCDGWDGMDGWMDRQRVTVSDCE